MRLLTTLIFRLTAVVLLCLMLATGWIFVSSHVAVSAATDASSTRVVKHLQALYWQKLLWRDGLQKEALLPVPEWQTLATQSIVAPGVCVSFAPPGADKQTLCSQVEALGHLPPSWFSFAYESLLGPHRPITAFLSVREKDAGTVVTFADPGAALRLAWSRVSTAGGIAAAMAASIAMLAALMIGHALLPAQSIIRLLHRLEAGDLAGRLPHFRSTAFNPIARAVNDLAERLLHTRNETSALTARLFQVQEEERRALARDLHDEFGQSLTATAALAALIEANASPGREDIAVDARAIMRTQQHMMETLRTALIRLRSQNIEEVGLEASLRQLIADHNAQSASKTAFRLDIAGSLTALQKRIAVDIYRIAQECLTNAARHGTSTEVRVRVEHDGKASGHVALVVEDDGGGDVRTFNAGAGHGILGMRERITAVGGALSIANVAHGIRVSAMIPLRALNSTAPPIGSLA